MRNTKELKQQISFPRALFRKQSSYTALLGKSLNLNPLEIPLTANPGEPPSLPSEWDI